MSGGDQMPKRNRRARPSPPRIINAAREPITLPEHERGLSPEEVARFDKAKSDLANPRLALSEAQKHTRAVTMAAVENSRVGEALKRWQEQAAAETARLARARGEDVEVQGDRVRIMSRGGLRQAYEDGHLGSDSETLHAKARELRDDYELAVGMATPIRGEGATGFRKAAPQQKRIEASYRLARYREALTSRQWEIVELVCCHDMRLRTAAELLCRGIPGAKNSLRGGLSQIAQMERPKPPKSEDPKYQLSAEDMASKTAKILAAEREAA
jgi:hypothetical protein